MILSKVKIFYFTSKNKKYAVLAIYYLFTSILARLRQDVCVIAVFYLHTEIVRCFLLTKVLFKCVDQQWG